MASPVLAQAERLDIKTLIECARIKNQEHLLAISRRKKLPEALTEVLVERGDQQVVLSIAKTRVPGSLQRASTRWSNALAATMR